MEPKWLAWARKHMPPELFEEMQMEQQYQTRYRDEIIDNLRSDYIAARNEADELRRPTP